MKKIIVYMFYMGVLGGIMSENIIPQATQNTKLSYLYILNNLFY